MKRVLSVRVWLAIIAVVGVSTFAALRWLNTSHDLPILGRYFLYVWGVPWLLLSFWLRRYVSAERQLRPGSKCGAELGTSRGLRRARFRSYAQMRFAWMVSVTSLAVILSLVANYSTSLFLQRNYVWIWLLSGLTVFLVFVFLVDET
jgi:hypothetical protein